MTRVAAQPLPLYAGHSCFLFSVLLSIGKRKSSAGMNLACRRLAAAPCWTNRRIESWYQCSLKQLSAIQMKQAGLLLGATVGDAASRPWQGFSSDAMAHYVSHAKELPSLASFDSGSTDPSPYAYGLHSTPFSYTEDTPRYRPDDFPRPSHLGMKKTGAHSPSLAFADTSAFPEWRPSSKTIDSLGYHSFSHHLHAVAVRCMNRVHSADFESEVVPMWISEVTRLISEDEDNDDETTRESAGAAANVYSGMEAFATEHGSLLHTLIGVLSVPVLYPYTSDDDLHQFTLPLIQFLDTPPSAVSTPSRPSSHTHVQTACVLTFLSVLLRYLQSNPNPLRNVAIQIAAVSKQSPFLAQLRQETGGDVEQDLLQMCLPLLFPPAVRQKCFTASPCPEMPVSLSTAPAGFVSLGGAGEAPRTLLGDMMVVQEALAIAARYAALTTERQSSVRCFEEGVEEAIRMGGAGVCQRATLVGALLGARWGVMAISPRWLSATADHEAMAGFSIHIAQRTWNTSE